MIKIAITGPECSGKTSLAIELGKELGINWIPEFARLMLKKLERPYIQEDLNDFARQQLKVINLVKKSASKYMVVDTEMLVFKIWSQEKYETVSEFITEAYANQDFDLIILCRPDMPYEPDPQRENPEDRDRLFEVYLAELKKSGANFIIAESNLKYRVNSCLSAIEKL